MEARSFSDLGLCEPLLKALDQLKFTTPTQIQADCIGPALEGRDIIGIAPTGSGKTAAFALPILHRLWDDPHSLFACVLSPTRELAYQTSAQFEALGASMGVRSVVIVGGEDKIQQAVQLAKKPHIVVATPGRLHDHLKTTKGFSLRAVKHLVLDEADRLLNPDFQASIDDILKLLPHERTTYLFSATMTNNVAKLQRTSLSDPVRVEASSHKYTTVSTLLQYYILCPLVQKEVMLVYLINSMAQNSIIIFARTVQNTKRITLILRSLGFRAIPLHGELTQSQRLGAFNKFKGGLCNILVATDLASRGLDVPSVDVVINFDSPTHSKDYIHRVGRTARAGRAGKSILMVSQYDVEPMLRLEEVLGRKLEQYPTDEQEIALLRERVEEAGRHAANQLREEIAAKGGGKKRRQIADKGDDKDRDDDVVEAGMPSFKRKRRS
ncbi:ATP-dependent rRNA helicase rrp3 [Hypsizygus marmoreus]|uniref:ATP-dependent rRNA helicase rrp3 n=1 Tax=Hypsizygus marmoreus TaxID=39966 RepID=A0A369JGM3_HYPMA|nr:ATP-dependent rRNA helicase rrp3 [Hypsizygus marmoreus]